MKYSVKLRFNLFINCWYVNILKTCPEREFGRIKKQNQTLDIFFKLSSHSTRLFKNIDVS